MTELHITRGLPASGKTTFARQWVAQDPTTRVRVNRDDTRAMVHSAHAGRATEDVTTTACHAAIRALLRNGRDVIVDDTNLNGGISKNLARIATQCGAEFVVHDFPIDLDEAVACDAQRKKPVGEDVITRMHVRYLAQHKGAFLPPVTMPQDHTAETKPYTAPIGADLAVIVDLDGTLAHNDGHRSFYDYSKVSEDSVHQPVLDLVWHLMQTGHTPIVVSGRKDTCRVDTVEWLRSRCGLEPDDYVGPFMRAADDNRDDGIVKLEIFDREIRDHFDVRYVLDDRNRVVRAWRSIGLTVLQVADGDF